MRFASLLLARRAWLAATLAAPALAGCTARVENTAWPNFGGDPARGAIIMTQSSCGACHRIPGLQQADGMVGPPLDHFARRTMIAGLLPNTPANLIRWVRSPQAVLPGNAMPDFNFNDAQARDVAAYLYSLH
jgi:cytochrome c